MDEKLEKAAILGCSAFLACFFGWHVASLLQNRISRPDTALGLIFSMCFAIGYAAYVVYAERDE